MKFYKHNLSSVKYLIFLACISAAQIFSEKSCLGGIDRSIVLELGFKQRACPTVVRNRKLKLKLLK